VQEADVVESRGTLEGVTERLGRLSGRLASQAGAATGRGEGPLAVEGPLMLEGVVREAEELLLVFERTEALHVSLGLQGGFEFAAAQEALSAERTAFARLLERARRELPLREERLTRRLDRAALLARRAPLTSPGELELIRAERRARAGAAV
jgi:hypothetical protein